MGGLRQYRLAQILGSCANLALAKSEAYLPKNSSTLSFVTGINER